MTSIPDTAQTTHADSTQPSNATVRSPLTLTDPLVLDALASIRSKLAQEQDTLEYRPEHWLDGTLRSLDNVGRINCTTPSGKWSDWKVSLDLDKKSSYVTSRLPFLGYATEVNGTTLVKLSNLSFLPDSGIPASYTSTRRLDTGEKAGGKCGIGRGWRIGTAEATFSKGFIATEEGKVEDGDVTEVVDIVAHKIDWKSVDGF
jgi:hypothetical protein